MRSRLQYVSSEVKRDVLPLAKCVYDLPMKLRRRVKDPDMIERFLAWKIAGLRAPGESLAQMGERLAVPKSTLDALLSRGEAGPKVRGSLCQILGLTPEQLLMRAAEWSEAQKAPAVHATTERPVSK